MNDKPKTWNIPARTAEGKELQRKYAEAWPGLGEARDMVQLNLDDIEAVLDRANDDADRVSVYEYRQALNAVYRTAMRILAEKMAAEGHESLSEARAFALERERILAWLRHEDRYDEGPRAFCYANAADAIERGDHAKPGA